MPLRDRTASVAEVAVYSTPMADVERNVAIVRAQILVAGAIALTLAVLAGWLSRARSRSASSGWRRRPSRSRPATSRARSRSTPTTSSASSRVAFNDMQRQLAQLDRARKQFIATASHELRTPLFSLGGFVELLEDEELDEETRARFLAQVRQQVDRLAKLSVDLLDLSRLEAGSLELRPEPVDLAELARSVSSEFEPALAQHDSHLEVRAPGARRSRRSATRCASRRSCGS